MAKAIKKPVQLLSFKQAVRALQGADVIVMQCRNTNDSALATFVGWENEGDENSAFVIGSEWWDDVHLEPGINTPRDGHVLSPSGHCVDLKLYKEKK